VNAGESTVRRFDGAPAPPGFEVIVDALRTALTPGEWQTLGPALTAAVRLPWETREKRHADALARFEGAPAPEPPGWAEFAQGIETALRPLHEAGVATAGTWSQLLASLRPLFERLAAARLLAEADAARLRKALITEAEFACDCDQQWMKAGQSVEAAMVDQRPHSPGCSAEDALAVLAATPARPAALVELVVELERDSAVRLRRSGNPNGADREKVFLAGESRAYRDTGIRLRALLDGGRGEGRAEG
jgi:hypothetical protein